MRHKLYFIFFFIIPLFSFGQCPNSNITLSSQAEVDSFVTNYPNCSEPISLRISGNDITDLTPLSTINYTELLQVVNNPLLTQLDGLNNLQSSISNNIALELDNNPLLSNLLPFSNLTSLSHLLIRDCHSLTNLEGLNFVTDFDPNGIGGGGFNGLSIVNNIVLTDISALANITNANIDIGMYPFFIRITNNPVLGSLNGLQAFDGIYDFLQIVNNDSLINLTGLSDNFGVADLPFVISDNDSLQSLGEIGGGFIQEILIDNNPLLTDISAFNNFDTAIPFLVITNNPGLAICNNIPFCASISELQFATDLYPLFTIENNAEGCNSVGEVANSCGFVPFNDDCGNAFPIALGELLTTYNEFASASPQMPSCNDINRIDVWFKVNSESFSNIDIIVDTGYNIQLWEGTCPNLVQVPNACNESNLMDVSVNTNTDYYIQVWSDSTTGRTSGLFNIVVQDATLSTLESEFEKIKFYPNPTTGILNMKSPQNIDFMDVTNLLGQQILKFEPNTTDVKIDLSELNSGMYLISIKVNDKSETLRIVKN